MAEELLDVEVDVTDAGVDGKGRVGVGKMALVGLVRGVSIV